MSDIAIVGMDCRFPRAPGPAQLWDLLMKAENAASAVGPDRWDADGFWSVDGRPGTVNTKRAGFIADADAFDSDFFGTPPREAEAMDPQQRLLLQTVWRAFEDATLDPRAQAGSSTAVFVGIMGNEWANLHMTDYRRITPQLGSGNGHCMTANRISYQFDLRGPSIAVDTACSSSLVATQLACAALRADECDQAVAAGVNVILTPALSIFYTQAGLSAPDARCKPFSAHADGIGRSEGVAAVVLRRLPDAIAERLPIYAVIRGGAVNSDGRSNGITAPNRWAQEDVVRQAYRRAGVGPQDIAFVEAHGTGTILGDMIEARALGAVHAVPRVRPCALGSVKGNLGHAEGAAGIAGLIKTALSLHHRIVPASLGARQENPDLRLADGGLRLLKAPMRLPPFPLLAGVSSFGLGGTNAHLVLASAPRLRAAPPPRPASDHPDAGNPDSADPDGPHVPAAPPVFVLTVSGPTEASLRTGLTLLADDVAGQPTDRLGQLAWTSNRSRSRGRRRFAVTVDGRDAAVAALRAAAAGNGPLRRPGHAGPPSVGWLLTGQGSQYRGMGRALHARYAVFRTALAEVDESMAPHLRRSVRALVLGDTPGADLLLDRTEWAQPALFAFGWSLGRSLLELGGAPDWMLGHSIGEIVAAALAGVFDLDGACELVCARGRLMGALPPGGGMLAVRAPLAQVEPLVAAEPEVAVAAVNGPTDVVVSGRSDALSRLRTRLPAAATVRPLAVSHAFHSPLMAPVRDRLAEVAAGIAHRPPSVPIYSTLRGGPLRTAGAAGTAGFGPAYWAEQLLAPVRFADAAAAALRADPTHLVEIGPRRVLLPLAANLPGGAGTRRLAPSPGPDATGHELAATVAALYTDGLDPRWDALYDDWYRSPRRLTPFRFSTANRYWTTPVTPATAAPAEFVVTRAPSGNGTRSTNSTATSNGMATSNGTATSNGVGGTNGVGSTNSGTTNGSAPAAARPAVGEDARSGATVLATDVVELIGAVSGHSEGEITMDADFLDELGYDSIMVMQLADRIEARWAVQLPVRDLMASVVTVGDLVTFLRGRLPTSGPTMLASDAAS